MKSWLVLLVIAVSGIGIGVRRNLFGKAPQCRTVFHRRLLGTCEASRPSPASRVSTATTAAKVEIVGDAVFDFGSMERFSKMQHTFRLKNVGESDLELTPWSDHLQMHGQHGQQSSTSSPVRSRKSPWNGPARR